MISLWTKKKSHNIFTISFLCLRCGIFFFFFFSIVMGWRIFILDVSIKNTMRWWLVELLGSWHFFFFELGWANTLACCENVRFCCGCWGTQVSFMPSIDSTSTFKGQTIFPMDRIELNLWCLFHNDWRTTNFKQRKVVVWMYLTFHLFKWILSLTVSFFSISFLIAIIS